MSYKSISFVYGFIVITLLTINCITADITDNEVNDETYMVQGVKVYQGDRECVLVGGLCVHSSDCLQPTSKTVPVRPAPCREHLGECMTRCNPDLMRPGTDCEDGQVCCVLV